MYEKCLKRLFDFAATLIALLALLPILLAFLLIGAIVMGGNPIFVQPRPGRKGKDGKEKIFYLLKLRSMSNRRDENGELLPDAERLGRYGKFLRSTSLDELPSLLNILVGHMSIVGPRPQLVRDMTFMSTDQRRRHNVRPGLTGLAQINGRNCISWEKKFEYDLKYIEKITLWGDVKIIFGTVGKVLRRADTVREGTVSDIDFGDYLLETGAVDAEEYAARQREAKELLGVK